MNKQLVFRLQTFGSIKKNKPVRVSSDLINIFPPRLVYMILIQPMLNTSFLIDFVDDLIALYWQTVTEADNFEVF